MEKRFVFFLILAFCILMLNVVISTMFWEAPQRPPVVDRNEAPRDEVVDDEAGADPLLEIDESPGEAELDVLAPDEPAEDEAPPAAEDEEQFPQRWLTLGSADPLSPYRMLVTFTNRGAAVRRLELASPRYTELNNRTGYLGHLQSVSNSEGPGVVTQVVGSGTPAAEAGMQAGDVLIKIGEADIDSPADLERALSVTKPGQEILLGVVRDGEPLEPLTATLRWEPLEVMGPEARNVLERKELLPPDFVDPPSYLLTLAQLGEANLADDDLELPGLGLRSGNWEVVEHQQTHVVFRKRLGERGIEVIKRFRIAEAPPAQQENPDYPAYHLEFDVEIRNLSESPREVAYVLDGPTGLPTEGWWYASKISRNWGGAGLRDLVVQYIDQAPIMFSTASIGEGEVPAMGQGKSLMYVGIDAQYFSSVLIPQKESLDDVWLAQTEGVRVGAEPDATADPRLLNVTFRVQSVPHTLEPNGQIKQTYTLFSGPKRPDLLTKYGQGESDYYNLDGLVYYGWPIWAVVSKIMLGILHFFYNIVGNYGVAIILLTVMVRGLMFPLSRKQALNMVKMQELQPEIKRIQKKYEKELEKRTKAQQDLFRKNNYNPMGGCLLMFVQLPVFLGLYRALMVDVELRQAPLLGEAIRWCSNLAAPDMLFDWSGFMPDFINSGQGIFGLGPYFNILPLVTVVLFIGQQKMFMPPPADEQAALQQKMMQYMMIFIGLMFYKVASGLCLYFIASTMWGMAERKLLPKTQPAETTIQPRESAAPAKSPPSTNGKRRAGKAKRKQK